MGLPEYLCPDDFPRQVPSLVARSGIGCAAISARGIDDSEGSIRYLLTRGRGTVEFIGLGNAEGQPYRFWLVCGNRPLYWFWDMRLFREVDRLLIGAGAERVGIEDVA